MFHHVKELQFNARVSQPDPQFAAILLEQFGGPNGELKAAMQYFVQSFAARQAYPDKYDMLMDISSEEFSHLEVVGATITMLLNGVNSELKNAADTCPLAQLSSGKTKKEELFHKASFAPQFISRTGGGPSVTDCQGVPWSGTFVNANGDLTVDLRSNIAAESRAKIVYEYLLKFTDDPLVRETLRFLMTREIAHSQMFSAALESIQPNFPPGVLQGDPRYTHAYFNMSDGASVRGPWNQGQGPWTEGETWIYIDDPILDVQKTHGEVERKVEGAKQGEQKAKELDKQLSSKRSQETKSKAHGVMQWSTYESPSLEQPRQQSR